MLLDPRGTLADVGVIPHGGGAVVLGTGDELTAEPIPTPTSSWCVAPVRGGGARFTVPAPRPRLSCACSAASPPRSVFGDAPLHLRPRHVELLTLLLLHRGRIGADALSTELYGDSGHAGSIRVEMSRLRKLLPDAVEPGGYAVTCEVDADLTRVRARSAAARSPRPPPPTRARCCRTPRRPASSARATSSTTGCARP